MGFRLGVGRTFQLSFLKIRRYLFAAYSRANFSAFLGEYCLLQKGCRFSLFFQSYAEKMSSCQRAAHGEAQLNSRGIQDMTLLRDVCSWFRFDGGLLLNKGVIAH